MKTMRRTHNTGLRYKVVKHVMRRAIPSLYCLSLSGERLPSKCLVIQDQMRRTFLIILSLFCPLAAYQQPGGLRGELLKHCPE